jgi:ATP/ADP translocase
VTQPDRTLRRSVIAAVLAAGTMIAFQTAGKATRDALFFSIYDPTMLPRTIMAAAVVSVLVALLASRWMTRLSPGRLVPLAFGASAALLLTEWALLAKFRAIVAIVVYLHFAALGAVLISGFWSVVNERFDPRMAKRHVGKITAGAAVGGVVGGLLAVWISTLGVIGPMFPALAAFHLICAVLTAVVREEELSHAAPGADPGMFSGVGVIARTPYLRALVALVLLVTVGEVLIDYVFKARAVAEFGKGTAALLGFFALFYTGIGLLTVVVQALASRTALQRLGLTRTVALLPTGVVLGGAGAMVVPRLAGIVVARVIESVVHNGLYRAGYELLFTPVTPRQKRAAKALVDVGVVRLGDIVGSGLTQLAIVVLAAAALNVLLGAAIAVSVVGVVVALRLTRGYIQALEKSLLSRAIQLDLDEVADVVTRSTMLQSASTLGMTHVRPGVVDGAESTSEPVGTLPTTADPELQRALDLRSRDASRVRAALRGGPLTPALTGYVIPLLAWDDVLREAIAGLRGVAPQATGQLVDHLLDQDEEFAIRRRIPIILASCPTQRAVDGLLGALDDARFEVRYRCGRVLNRLHELNPRLVIRRERIFEIVLKEAAVDRGVWESHRLLDTLEDDQWSPVMDEMLRERANRGLEHVFTLLSLVLQRQPLKIAFRGLHAEDRQLRGTALEYLETALPEEIRRALWPFLEAPAARRPSRRSAQDVLDALMRSNRSIAMDLARARRMSDGEPGNPAPEPPAEQS